MTLVRHDQKGEKEHHPTEYYFVILLKVLSLTVSQTQQPWTAMHPMAVHFYSEPLIVIYIKPTEEAIPISEKLVANPASKQKYEHLTCWTLQVTMVSCWNNENFSRWNVGII